MRILKIIGLLLILSGVSLLAQTPSYLIWDYQDSELPEVVEFQVKYNSGAYTTVGLPSPEILSDTQPNHKSFRVLIPTSLTTGQSHIASVRACSSTECSWDSFLNFKFIGPASNLRIKK